jgi:hypothetical protein
MTKRWALSTVAAGFGFFAVAPSIQPQRTEVPPQICRGDAFQWGKDLSAPTIKEMRYEELYYRAHEMMRCFTAAQKTVGTPQDEMGMEVMVTSAYNVSMNERLMHYLGRHNQYDSFVKEDEHGLR